MIAIVDNYDSFSHNLEQYIGEFTEVNVDRYEFVPEADGYVFSPGPGRPGEFPIMRRVLKETRVPVLGVCLGHQAIAEYYGGEVVYSDEVVHGKTSEVKHDCDGIFDGLPNPLNVGRYHSLVVGDPGELEVSALGAGVIMGVRHPTDPVYGVQFHPESVLTPNGKKLIRNFVKVVDAYENRHG